MKLGIIGIGSVGGAIATAVHYTGLIREMVLIDRDELRAQAAAMDLGHAAVFGFDTNIRSGGYDQLKGADIVIISAGANQKPGQTRTDLLKNNAAAMSDVVPQIMKNVDAKKVILIVVSNPLDAMVAHVAKVSGLPSPRVIGTGTMLDSARFRTLLSRQLAVSTQSISAYVLGEHGDSSVLNWSAASVGNIPLDDFAKMSAAAKKTIEHRVRNAAYEIIKGRGATWDGIGAAAADLIRAIANDEKRILTISVGAGSLPMIVGAGGVVATLRPRLSAAEAKQLRVSQAIIRRNCSEI